LTSTWPAIRLQTDCRNMSARGSCEFSPCRELVMRWR
jgi:hypothetical protein